MSKKLIVTVLLGSLVAPLSAMAADAPATPEHTFTGNVTLASEDFYRGIAQTRGKPTGAAKPDTTEVYGALSYKWLTLKQSQSTGETHDAGKGRLLLTFGKPF